MPLSPAGVAALAHVFIPAAVERPEPGEWTQICTAGEIAAQVPSAGGQPYPLAVKANISVRGLRRSAGCALLDLAPEEADAPVVALLRRSGAVVVGMANMHELAFGITSRNASYGAVRLPGRPDRSAGGSSGGSAAVVARGHAEVALGTDTGGSISIPASLCGVAGFRPSTGRWPTAGTVGLSWTRDTPGIFARSVRRLAEIDLATLGGTPGQDLPRPRIGVPAELFRELHASTRAAVEPALAVLAGAAELVPVRLAEVWELTRAAAMPVVRWEARRLLGDVAARALGMNSEQAFARLVAEVRSPDVRQILEAEMSSPVSPGEYAIAQRQTEQARACYTELLHKHALDALAFPATPAPAPPACCDGPVEHRGSRVDAFELYTRNTTPGAMLGAPMVTFPLATPATGLPVGLTVQGARFDDRRTLRLAERMAAGLSDTAEQAG
ncbi:amidase [Amycolatopsis rubida]|uniref:Amidase n=1 Tax=Amycolatopsis rubida TaxID=112413 RepID=A0ABX0BS90_9PSEU|nr:MULTISPECIES: amidase family protein [Amycolatopsis]MYW90710.1 amidase [Amycolatopsis rubida]NEC55693.1 amidase [Amycolatopsis rubida]OAP23765.1 Mandelamide hydrolase [Amycolatopsis sp. M39]